MAGKIDYYENAKHLITLADEVGYWEEDDFTAKKMWAVEQYHQAAIASAILALVDEIREGTNEGGQDNGAA